MMSTELSCFKKGHNLQLIVSIKNKLPTIDNDVYRAKLFYYFIINMALSCSKLFKLVLNNKNIFD